jgi:hypothetical protein
MGHGVGVGDRVKGRNGLGLVVAVAALIALLAPTGAAARPKPASRQTPARIEEQLGVQGSKGFLVGATLDNRRAFSLSASKFGDVIEGATYKLRVHPRRGSDDIVARLGKLGRIDVRFVPHKVRRKRPEEGCKGGKTVIEEGALIGLIAFHGERGFTRVHTHRAAGSVVRTPTLTCKPPRPLLTSKQIKKFEREIEEVKEKREEEGKEAEEESFDVGLHATARGHRAILFATKGVIKPPGEKGFALTNIVAGAERHRGRIDESAYAFDLLGKGSDFLVPNRRHPAAEGILKPPAPFMGSATFRRESAKKSSWTGDLRIDLPGFGLVRFTGAGTEANMCEGLACVAHGGAPARSLARLEGELR